MNELQPNRSKSSRVESNSVAPKSSGNSVTGRTSIKYESKSTLKSSTNSPANARGALDATKKKGKASAHPEKISPNSFPAGS